MFGDALTTKCDQLIEHRLGVTHASVCSFGDGPCCRVIEVNAFLGGNILQVLGDGLGGDGPQVEALAARYDGGEDLIRFGGGENELYVLRRLLECFEQGIEGGRSKHVHLVNIVDFEFTLCRGELNVFADISDVIDTIVGGSVNFDNI